MPILSGTAKSTAEGGFYPLEINQSLRFDDGSSSYLSRTPSVAGNRKTWTWSGWVKRGNLGLTNALLNVDDGTLYTYLRVCDSSDKVFFGHVPNTGGTTYQISTDAVLRDPSAWYHIVYSIDTTQATASDRVKIYINGVLQSVSTNAYGYPTQNLDMFVNSTYAHQFGAFTRAGGQYFDGYLAEVHFTDGTAYTADAFGQFKSGVWVAKKPSVAYGTNGFHLDFSDSGALGTDAAGSNNWTPTNLASTDVMLDSPTNNFATLNSVYPNPNNVSVNTTLAEGNLKSTVATGSLVVIDRAATFGMTSGKWYWECKIDAISAPNGAGHTGIRSATGTSYSLSNNGLVFTNWTVPTYSGNSSYVAGDIIGVAYDADNGNLYFYKNGVVGNGGTPILSGLTGEWYPCAFNLRDTTTSGASTHNFGQDSSFAGTKTPQGNTDDNGIGDFYYEPPTGYLALCTSNLPEPAISPADGASPSDYMNTVLYTGTGTTRSVTGVGFQPDLIWTKSRSNPSNHGLVDVIRGTNKVVFTDSTDAEYTLSAIDSFDSDGFTTSSSGSYNNLSGWTYAAWNWKANGTPVTNTDGTITSSVSANTESGFSIVSYTGTGVYSTFGHGLSSAPEMLIIKQRNSADNWAVYHKDVGTMGALSLNTTGTPYNTIENWQNTAPSDSVVYIGRSGFVNNDPSKTYICYAFHSIEGFSKFGSYTGNGSADGPFVNLGFRPSFVMVKRTDNVGNWQTYDGARDTYNTHEHVLFPNLSNAEGVSSGYALDTLSNGFKLRSTDSDRNANGGTYIFISFSSNPFKYSNAR